MVHASGRLVFVSAALWILSACSGSGGDASDESSANPGEEVAGETSEAVSVSKTLYYEGSCSWLKCTNHNTATGACGYGCSDTANRLARDYKWRWSCGKYVKVCHSGYCATAKIWDSSCCGRMEGNKALLSAVHISHGDGACGHYGYGSGSATFYW